MLGSLYFIGWSEPLIDDLILLEILINDLWLSLARRDSSLPPVSFGYSLVMLGRSGSGWGQQMRFAPNFLLSSFGDESVVRREAVFSSGLPDYGQSKNERITFAEA